MAAGTRMHSRFDEVEKRVVRSVREGIIFKHGVRRWQNVIQPSLRIPLLAGLADELLVQDITEPSAVLGTLSDHDLQAAYDHVLEQFALELLIGAHENSDWSDGKLVIDANHGQHPSHASRLLRRQARMPATGRCGVLTVHGRFLCLSGTCVKSTRCSTFRAFSHSYWKSMLILRPSARWSLGTRIRTLPPEGIQDVEPTVQAAPSFSL